MYVVALSYYNDKNFVWKMYKHLNIFAQKFTYQLH